MLSTPLFQGQLIRLTAMRNDDLSIMTRWYESSEFARLFDYRPAFPRNERRLQGWVNDSDRDRDSNYTFGIRTLYSDDLIGVVELDGIVWSHRVGWLGIAIGDPTHRRRGYGREAIEMTLRFAFTELNLHRVQLTVFSYNMPAIRLYQSLGFTHEGTQREALHRDGAHYDMLMFGLLAREWGADAR
jgi:RimJ/RimL family protein N-acetyltransferase